MSAPDLVFALLCVIVVFGAAMAVFLKNVFHNALALGLSLFGIAGLYLCLHAEFLAVMQVIIYVGAIAVAILFAIMLSHPMTAPEESLSFPRVWRAGALSLGIFLALVKIWTTAPWRQAAHTASASVGELGARFLGPNALAFEAVSLALLAALIGALVISRKGS